MKKVFSFIIVILLILVVSSLFDKFKAVDVVDIELANETIIEMKDELVEELNIKDNLTVYLAEMDKGVVALIQLPSNKIYLNKKYGLDYDALRTSLIHELTHKRLQKQQALILDLINVLLLINIIFMVARIKKTLPMILSVISLMIIYFGISWISNELLPVLYSGAVKSFCIWLLALVGFMITLAWLNYATH